MANKPELRKAFDAGQAAQRYGYGEDSNPFEEGHERDSWQAGFEQPLAEKWLTPGRAHSVKVDN